MKKKISKLALNRETIRQLDAYQLAHAAGGGAVPVGFLSLWGKNCGGGGGGGGTVDSASGVCVCDTHKSCTTGTFDPAPQGPKL
jgi:hypothetical protein